MTCPQCTFAAEDKRELADHLERVHINRGRRFFLLGALALPVARKIELAAAPFASPPLVHMEWSARGGGMVVRMAEKMRIVLIDSKAAASEWRWLRANTHSGI